MAESRYAPPKAKVADVLPIRHPVWGRAIWFQLPIFAGLLLLALTEIEVVTAGLLGWGGLAGLAMTAVLLYVPARALRELSEAPPSWWWDALYYTSVAAGLIGLLVDDANVMIAGGTPTVMLNGILGVMALLTEKRRHVRVYFSARRYHFSPDRAL